jgi:hypothetical protein
MSVALTNIHQMLRTGASVPSTRPICMASHFLCRSGRDTAFNAFAMPLQRRYAGLRQGLYDLPEVGRVSTRARLWFSCDSLGSTRHSRHRAEPPTHGALRAESRARAWGTACLNNHGSPAQVPGVNTILRSWIDDLC